MSDSKNACIKQDLISSLTNIKLFGKKESNTKKSGKLDPYIESVLIRMRTDPHHGSYPCPLEKTIRHYCAFPELDEENHETETLVKLIKESPDTEEAKGAIEKIINAYTYHTVICTIFKMDLDKYMDDIEDFIQIGQISLMLSIFRWNPQKASFHTYAQSNVAFKVRRYKKMYCSHLNTGIQYVELYGKIMKFSTTYYMEHGREPSLDEICLWLEMTEDELKKDLYYISCANVESINRLSSGPDGEESSDYEVEDIADPTQDIENTVIEEILMPEYYHNEIEKTVLSPVTKEIAHFIVDTKGEYTQVELGRIYGRAKQTINYHVERIKLALLQSEGIREDIHTLHHDMAQPDEMLKETDEPDPSDSNITKFPRVRIKRHPKKSEG